MEKQMVEIDLEQKTINVLKALIMDTVRNANSGHTGGPLSSLDFTYILFKEFLKYDSKFLLNKKILCSKERAFR